MIKKVIVVTNLIFLTSCVTFKVGGSSEEKVPSSKFSKHYLLIKSESNNSNGLNFFLPPQIQLGKILPAVSNCDQLTNPNARKEFSELRSDVSTLLVACEFYVQLNSISDIKWEIVDKEEDAKDGVLYSVHLKSVVPTGTWRNIWGYTSLFTLGIIPIWSFDHQIQMQASVRKVKTKDSPLVYQATEKWGFFGQTLLVVAMPFTGQSRGFRNTYKELSKKLILNASENNLY